MNGLMYRVSLCLAGAALCGAIRAEVTLTETGRTSGTHVLISGMEAGPFNPDYWTSGSPHAVPDVRFPLMEPRAGAYRNIYAPSAVALPGGGWCVYYGAWDGISVGKDHIYAVITQNFRSMDGVRASVLDPDRFHHVCNVNAQLSFGRAPGTTLMCTVLPTEPGLNKPALFRLNEPVPAAVRKVQPEDFVHIAGYPHFAGADINGMNVLLQDGDRSLLYFGDFKNFGHVYAAVGDSATTTTFQFHGSVLDGNYAVNDVKKLRGRDGNTWYLMGMHMNGNRLYYSLSRDALRFGPAETLQANRQADDRYMVAVGFVADADSPQGARTIYGYLYGAGAMPSLDANRLFATWFQKKLKFTPEATSAGAPVVMGGLGPETVQVQLPAAEWTGRLEVTDEGGTPLGVTYPVTLRAGHEYKLH